MANHRSALKRERQSRIRRMRNRMNKARMKTAIRRVEEAIKAGAREQADQALVQAISIIQKTASKGTLHRKTASRKVARLTRKVNKLAQA